MREHSPDLGLLDEASLAGFVSAAVDAAEVLDIHTHLWPCGPRRRRPFQELLTYHYLAAETVAVSHADPAAFLARSSEEQARITWDELFVKRSPLSEAARGVLTVLRSLGLSMEERRFDVLDEAVASACPMSEVLARAKVRQVVMTNDPFVPEEWSIFQRQDWDRDAYWAAVRLDGAFAPGSGVAHSSLPRFRAFLASVLEESQAKYVSLTLDGDALDRLTGMEAFRDGLVPMLEERSLPLMLMLGVRRHVHPAMGDAGDGLGSPSLAGLARLLETNPRLRVLATVLSAGAQQELAVLGRIFPQLWVFGFWWHCNVPSVIRSVLDLRFDLLGLRFIPQHSDARTPLHLLYKWNHFKVILSEALVRRYRSLLEAGWPVTREDVRRDVHALLSGNALEALS